MYSFTSTNTHLGKQITPLLHTQPPSQRELCLFHTRKAQYINVITWSEKYSTITKDIITIPKHILTTRLQLITILTSFYFFFYDRHARSSPLVLGPVTISILSKRFGKTNIHLLCLVQHGLITQHATNYRFLDKRNLVISTHTQKTKYHASKTQEIVWLFDCSHTKQPVKLFPGTVSSYIG